MRSSPATVSVARIATAGCAATSVLPDGRGGIVTTEHEVQARVLTRRNERLLLVGVACYALLVAALMFRGGLAITPDVMAVALALAAVLLGRGRLFLRDWLPFVALLLAYELMRGLADDAGFPIHMADLIVVDRLLGLGHLPTQVLQDAFHPASGVDRLAMLATAVYMLHFALPLVTGFVLWAWRRSQFYDFVAALILLSLAAFVTYLLLPAAPPWYAASHGALNGPDGRPVIAYLKPGAFETVAEALGFDGNYIYTYAFYGVGPNAVAAWPSLHIAYPFLTFLVLRRAFGRVGWLAFGYTLLVAFSVVYTGDHWVHDCIAGMAYAYVAYYVVVHTPRPVRVRIDGAVTRAGRRLRTSVEPLAALLGNARLPGD